MRRPILVILSVSSLAGILCGLYATYAGLDGKWKDESQFFLRKYLRGHNIMFNEVSVNNAGLVHLDLENKDVGNIEFLRNVPCEEVVLRNTKVVDLSPLTENRTLRSLDVGKTRISDLSPLSRTCLEKLNITDTEVTDLSPLTNVPLQVLFLGGSLPLSDISPLTKLPLTDLYFSTNMFETCSNVIEVLHRIPSLRTINCLPSTEFYKTYEGADQGQPLKVKSRQ